MNPRRSNADDPLEPLLREFFAREMPRDLRESSDSAMFGDSVASGVRPTGSRRQRRQVLLGMLAAGLVACVAALAGRTPIDATPSSEPAVATDRPESVPSATSADAARARQTGGPDSEPLFVIEGTAAGMTPVEPVERRARSQWTSADSDAEPIERVVPNEIAVEILPLDREDAKPHLRPQTPPDARLPEQRSRDR